MNILDPKFRYVNSASTDIRKTFARIRRELRESETTKSAPARATVVTLERARVRRVV